MPQTRKRERRLWPITLTIAEAANALGVDRHAIYDGVKFDGLALYRRGVRRFLLTADLVEWVRATWNREQV
jgi:excisionase family DNA binding protein